MTVQYHPSLFPSYPAPSIQFGTYNINENVSFLENAVVELQQQNILLIQQSIERDNELQREKDSFMTEMTAILYKKTAHYNELLNEKLQFEEELTFKNYEIARLKDIVTNHGDTIEKLEVANNEIVRLKNDIKQMIVDLSRARSIATTVNSIPLKKMVSVGVECLLGDEELKIYRKKIDYYEKRLYDGAESVNNLIREVENERSISAELLKTLKIKEAIACRECDLRKDFEYLTNTIRMYLEVEMTKMAAELKASGISGFAIAAFSMYKGYCNGHFENLLTESIKERTKTPVTTPINYNNTIKNVQENIIIEYENTASKKKLQKKKK